MVVRARRGSWFVDDGGGRSSPFWGSRWWGVFVAGWLSPLVGSGWLLWLSSLVAVNGRWASLVGSGGWLWSSPFSWAVRVVMVKQHSMFVDVPRRWTCACLACEVASLVVVMVGGGCEPMVMVVVVGVAAVGDGGDVAALGCCNDGGGWCCGWSLCAVITIHHVGGRCWSLCVLMVVVRKEATSPNKHCLLHIH